MKSFKVNILRIAVILVTITILLACVYWIPNIANFMEDHAPEFSYIKLPLLLGIYLTAIPFCIAVFNVFKLLKLIEEDVVFSMDSIKILSIISKCSIAEIVLYSLGLVYLYINNAMQPGIILLSLLIMLAAFIIYIFIEILEELLLKAVQIKTENELTI